MLLLQIAGKSKNAQPPPGFFQFAKSNPILRTKVPRTRAIIRFVEVGGRTDRGIYQLDRKFNSDATAMMQFLRYANDVARKEHRTLADVVGFSGFLFVINVWMLHREAFQLPLRREALIDLTDLGFLGIWDLDLGIWDFRCVA